jgi:hypothetical protein
MNEKRTPREAPIFGRISWVGVASASSAPARRAASLSGSHPADAWPWSAAGGMGWSGCQAWSATACG